MCQILADVSRESIYTFEGKDPQIIFSIFRPWSFSSFRPRKYCKHQTDALATYLKRKVMGHEFLNLLVWPLAFKCGSHEAFKRSLIGQTTKTWFLELEWNCYTQDLWCDLLPKKGVKMTGSPGQTGCELIWRQVDQRSASWYSFKYWLVLGGTGSVEGSTCCCLEVLGQ